MRYSGPLRGFASFSSLTLISRLTGLVRDVAMAAAFGASAYSDAFVIAFRIPNALRRLFADGALSAAFIPALVREGGSGRRALADFVSRMIGTLSVVTLAVAVSGMLLAPVLSMLSAPGMVADPARRALLGNLLRITFFFLPCVSLAALAGAVLMSQGRFGRWALAPALLNLSMAAAAWWGAPRMAEPIMAMGWAVLAGGVLQAVWLCMGVRRLGLLAWPRWGVADPRMRGVFKAMLPMLAGSSVAQVSLLVSSALASMLRAGSQTWLFQADRFLELPLALLGTSMGMVLLPTLAREFAEGGRRAADTLVWALGSVMWVTVPATAGLVVLAEPLMVTFFQYGRYGVEDARMAALALVAMTMGLPALAAIKVMLPAYHARGDLATPVRISCVSLVANGICSVGLLAVAATLGPDTGSGGMDWAGRLSARPGLHALLALVGAAANALNAALLWRGLRRRGLLPRAGMRREHLRLALASLCMVLVLIPLRDGVDLGAMAAWRRALVLAGLVGIGLLAFACTWTLMGGRLDGLRRSGP